MKWAAGLLMIAVGMMLVLPSLAYFVAHAVYVTLGSSFSPGSVAGAAAVGIVLIVGGFWILRSR
jgi:hypothetical protein